MVSPWQQESHKGKFFLDFNNPFIYVFTRKAQAYNVCKSDTPPELSFALYKVSNCEWNKIPFIRSQTSEETTEGKKNPRTWLKLTTTRAMRTHCTSLLCLRAGFFPRLCSSVGLEVSVDGTFVLLLLFVRLTSHRGSAELSGMIYFCRDINIESTAYWKWI